jgi:hypothetical protein
MDFAYDVANAALPVDTKVEFYWASGPGGDNIISPILDYYLGMQYAHLIWIGENSPAELC